MKRCPTCNRLESDSSLGFCRVDGSPLAEASSEIETSLLPQTVTDSGRVRYTGSTTVLPASDVQSSTGQLRNAESPRTHVASTRSSLIAGAIGVVIVTVLGVGSYWMYGRSAKPISSIAVMPFVNESGNADVEYLSDGMTETLIASLSQLPNLNVRPRSSVFRYKGKATDAKSIGKELNVQAVLNGHVMQRGDQLILSLELVNAETENVIWSEQYNRKQADLVSLQTEIARDVSSKLKTKLSGADAAKLEKTYTTNSEAYKLYLQGRFYWNKRQEKDFRKAVEYYDQAIALDRNYALAYAGQA